MWGSSTFWQIQPILGGKKLWAKKVFFSPLHNISTTYGNHSSCHKLSHNMAASDLLLITGNTSAATTCAMCWWSSAQCPVFLHYYHMQIMFILHPVDWNLHCTPIKYRKWTTCWPLRNHWLYFHDLFHTETFSSCSEGLLCFNKLCTLWLTSLPKSSLAPWHL